MVHLLKKTIHPTFLKFPACVRLGGSSPESPAGVSSNMATQKHCFSRWLTIAWMITRGTPISGNLHVFSMPIPAFAKLRKTWGAKCLRSGSEVSDKTTGSMWQSVWRTCEKSWVFDGIRNRTGLKWMNLMWSFQIQQCIIGYANDQLLRFSMVHYPYPCESKYFLLEGTQPSSYPNGFLTRYFHPYGCEMFNLAASVVKQMQSIYVDLRCSALRNRYCVQKCRKKQAWLVPEGILLRCFHSSTWSISVTILWLA